MGKSPREQSEPGASQGVLAQGWDMDRCSHLPGAALKSIPLLKPLLFEFLGSVPRVPSATQFEVGTRSSVVLGSPTQAGALQQLLSIPPLQRSSHRLLLKAEIEWGSSGFYPVGSQTLPRVVTEPAALPASPRYRTFSSVLPDPLSPAGAARLVHGVSDDVISWGYIFQLCLLTGKSIFTGIAHVSTRGWGRYSLLTSLSAFKADKQD